MLEKEIEAYLVKRCKGSETLCDKFTSPSQRSVPDRIITFKGRVIFVEMKAPGKKPTVLQCRDHARRRAAGAEVVWLDGTRAVEQLLLCVWVGKPISVNDDFKVVPL